MKSLGSFLADVFATLAVVIGLAGAAFLVIAGASVLNGIILVKLWSWFAVPMGLPALRIPIAIGLDMIFSFLQVQPAVSKKDETGAGEKLGLALLRSVIFLVMGFVVHLFV